MQKNKINRNKCKNRITEKSDKVQKMHRKEKDSKHAEKKQQKQKMHTPKTSKIEEKKNMQENQPSRIYQHFVLVIIPFKKGIKTLYKSLVFLFYDTFYIFLLNKELKPQLT